MGILTRSLREVLLQAVHLFLNQAADAMFCQIDLSGAHAQGFSDFPDWPFFHHVQVEYLKLFLFNLALHAVNGSIKQVLFPFLVPMLFQRWPVRASKLLQRGLLAFWLR